jgi:hypothetical protein
VSTDGSPFGLYARLAERSADAELIHGLLPPGGDVLDGTAAEQRFSVSDVDDARLAVLAGPAGLAVDRVLTEDRTLVLLRPA